MWSNSGYFRGFSREKRHSHSAFNNFSWVHRRSWLIYVLRLPHSHISSFRRAAPQNDGRKGRFIRKVLSYVLLDQVKLSKKLISALLRFIGTFEGLIDSMTDVLLLAMFALCFVKLKRKKNTCTCIVLIGLKYGC